MKVFQVCKCDPLCSGNLVSDFLSEQKREEVLDVLTRLGCYSGDVWRELGEEESDQFRFDLFCLIIFSLNWPSGSIQSIN